MTAGVFFDVDGTLVDSVYFHTIAWSRACRECGVETTAAHLHKLIGMGGDQFVEALVGDAMPELDEAHNRHMAPFEPEVQIFPGARELILELRRQGVHIAVASSGGAQVTEATMRRILPDLSVVDTLVTRDDIRATKPAPDLVAVALQRSNLAPDDVMYVGDTGWDVEAASRCGVRTVAVRSGGWTEEELQRAGAAAVFDDVGHLLRELPASPLATLFRS